VFRKNILFCVQVLLCFESFKIVQYAYSGVHILSRYCSIEFKTLCLLVYQKESMYLSC